MVLERHEGDIKANILQEKSKKKLVWSHLSLIAKCFCAKSSNFNGNLHNWEFHVRAKHFPKQISQQVHVAWF